MMRFLRRFGRSEDGAATIEFLIWFLVFWSMLMFAFEQGMYLARQVVLDRAVDMTAREVRLGLLDDIEEMLDPSLSEAERTRRLHDAIKDRVCQYSFMIPDCRNQVKLELQRRNPRDWNSFAAGADCVDRSDPGVPDFRFEPGESNDLMVLRACALIDPYFPTTGLGARLGRGSGGAFALVAVQSFAIEPEED